MLGAGVGLGWSWGCRDASVGGTRCSALPGKCGESPRSCGQRAGGRACALMGSSRLGSWGEGCEKRGENHYMAGKSAWAQAPAGRNSRVMERGTLQRQELIWILPELGHLQGVSSERVQRRCGSARLPRGSHASSRGLLLLCLMVSQIPVSCEIPALLPPGKRFDSTPPRRLMNSITTDALQSPVAQLP